MGLVATVKKMRTGTAVNLASRLVSSLSRRIFYKRDFFYGKVYGSYDLCYEVDLAVSTVNAINNLDSIVLDVGANKGDYSALMAT
jgi:hypothetical protein